LSSTQNENAIPEIALVTGASMGLGEVFARQLSTRGAGVILTARKVDLLEKLAAEIRTRGQKAWVFPCDLSQPDAPSRIEEFLRSENLRPTWLINNAGFGDALPFEKMTPERVRSICEVNMSALTELTARLLPILKLSRGKSRIINVASVAGFQPVPYFAVYSATKAYVLSFSEALHEELKASGIRVTCLCPGYTATNFAANNGLNKKIFTSAQSAEAVVRSAINASDRGKAVAITRNRAQIFALRFMPRFIVRRVAAMVAKSYH
jgi:short-subunit dehydrogenase